MRLGLITGEFPPMEGGVGAFTECLAQAMSEMGHEIHVVTHREARSQGGEDSPSWRTLREPLETAWGMVHPVARRWNWQDVGRLAQIAMRYELDILNVQYQAAAYNMRHPAINLAPWRLRGISPVVTTFHDLRVPYLFPKAGRIRNLVVRLVAEKSNGVIVTNGEDREVVQGWLNEPGRLAEIPIGSNIALHEAGQGAIDAWRRGLPLRSDDFLLGYFGFLNPSKGADILIEALSELEKHVHLVFLGGQTGSSDTEVNRQFADEVASVASDLGVSERVHWTGFLSDRELSVAMQACNLMVMPYRDGASLRRGTLMAALAHGQAVVTTEPVSRVQELTHGENVWLVARDSAAALSEAIALLQNDANLRHRLGQGALLLSQQFGWGAIAEATVAFFSRFTR